MFAMNDSTGFVIAVSGAIALVSFRPALGEPAAATREHPYSIVAQSTAATAGTGRRPLGRRIAASNLPVRAANPADCAPPPPQQPQPVPPSPDAPSDTPPTEAPEPWTAGFEPADVPAIPVAVLADAEPADDATAGDADPPEESAAPTEPPASAPDVAGSGPDQTAGESQVDAEPAVIAAAEASQPAVAPAPAAAPPRSRPAEVIRGNVLQRIRGAFGPRARAAAPTTRVPESPRVAAPPALPPAVQQVVAVVTEPATESAPVAIPEPARLEFDVRESRALVGEGEQLVMRIAVRNIGGEPAERVTASLFFAEGIEPVQAIGHAAEVYPGEVRFETVPQLPPGASVDLLVTAVGTRPGSVPYRGELTCVQPAGRVAREGAVMVRSRTPAEP